MPVIAYGSLSVLQAHFLVFYQYFTENKAVAPQKISFDMDEKAISGKYAGAYGVTEFTKIKSVLDTVSILLIAFAAIGFMIIMNGFCS